MSKQSASGNYDSADKLDSSFKNMQKSLKSYHEILDDIWHTVNDKLIYEVFKGCSTYVEKEDETTGKNFEASGIMLITDNFKKLYDQCFNSALYIELFNDELKDIKSVSKTIEVLAYEIKRYQNEINKVLSDNKMKSSAVKAMAAAGFASNKYDAKNGDYIPKEKVSTASDSWEGDLKFVRQDNGTYLVIKVGKDGSEVPMGYTTKKGKNDYYKEAKAKVLEDLKKNNTSSKEETASSNEETTSSNEKNIASNSNSKSTYASSDDISKSIKQTFGESILKGNDGMLTAPERRKISENFANDLKKHDITKTNLKDCDYFYRTTIEDGKKIVHVEASKTIVTRPNGQYVPTTKRVFNTKYEL